MFVTFFTELKQAGLPVSVREYLTLMAALDQDLAEQRVEDFYFLARVTLVKDERNLDKFDRVFSRVFKGLQSLGQGEAAAIPEEWLRKLAEKTLTEEEKALIESLGGWDKLMETLKQRLEEQKGRHQGGSKWIGTAGTSPFGAYGYNPEGVRIGQDESRHRRAVKVWDQRAFKDLDDTVELGTRNIKVALKRLRKFARTEFKTMEWFYFHNCLYEFVWKHNRRRQSERIPTWDVLHKYPHDYKIIFVGDAAMSPYEISIPGGSVEHWNDEPGAVWLARVAAQYPKTVWLNPVPEPHWTYSQSTALIRQVLGERMYPLTLDGLDRAVKELAR